MDSLKLYLKYLRINLESQLQYKASFLMMAAGHFLITFIEFFGLWILFDRFGSIKGFNFEEAALFYGIIHMGFAICEGWTRGFDVFPKLVRSGDFDRILLRPRSTVLQILGQDIQLMRFGRFIQGFIVLVWSLTRLNISWTLGKTLLLIGAILGGNFLFSGLIVLQATLSFWSIQSLEIMNSFTYGGVQAGQYPISIYKPWFRNVLIYLVPIASVNYFPAMNILGKADPLGYPYWIGSMSPFVGLTFFILSLYIWQFGVRHYSSTGS